MSEYYQTQGIVLSQNDFREADQVFEIYTKDFGRLNILARSIRKIKSKLRSGIDLFSFSEIEFIQGKVYKTLTNAIALDKYRQVKKDLNKLKTFYQIRELSNDLIHGQKQDEEIFYLLNQVFNKLNSCQFLDEQTCRLVHHYFLWNLLSLLGYQINPYNCIVCQKKLVPERICFNSKEKGIVCCQCLDTIPENRRVSLEVVKIIRVFLKKDLDTVLKLKILESDRKLLEIISQDFLVNIEQKRF